MIVPLCRRGDTVIEDQCRLERFQTTRLGECALCFLASLFRTTVSALSSVPQTRPIKMEAHCELVCCFSVSLRFLLPQIPLRRIGTVVLCGRKPSAAKWRSCGACPLVQPCRRPEATNLRLSHRSHPAHLRDRPRRSATWETVAIGWLRAQPSVCRFSDGPLPDLQAAIDRLAECISGN